MCFFLQIDYADGVVHGQAKIVGANGDKEICTYVKGVKQGPAKYFWKAGHKYDNTHMNGCNAFI